MSDSLAFALRAHGFDVETPLENGMLGRDGEEQLHWAAEQGYTVYTFNVAHFAHLYARWLGRGQSHAGIVGSPQQSFSIGDQVRALLAISGAMSAEEMVDRLEYLSGWARR